MNEKPIGVYIHIPFCKAKCNYCDFVSFARAEADFEPYVNALLREMEASELLQTSPIQTIYIGGGTPTVLPSFLMQKLLNRVFQLADNRIFPDAEVTVEANPGTLSPEYLKMLKDGGANRLSMGLQAWRDERLRELGRIHTRAEFLRNYADAVSAGFDNINIDLMFALNGQTMDEWEEALRGVIALAPKHVSAYALTVEEHTPFGKLYAEGKMRPVSDELDRRMYYKARDMLADAGIFQYEISNFAARGYEARHNNIYWKREPYLGFGLAAHSFVAPYRFANTADLQTYLKDSANAKAEKIELTRADAQAEFMFLGLRLTKGVDERTFAAAFGENMFDVYGEVLHKYLGLGLLTRTTQGVALTERGMDVCNLVFEDLI